MREFLLSIGVKEDDIENCIINEKGVFIPTYDSEGNITATAQENYDECIKQIDICTPNPKTNEQLTKENEQLWDTVNFLLKSRGYISSNVSEV